MPIRYSVSFTGAGLDERGLRRVLKQLGARDVTIVSSREEPAGNRLSKIQEAIMRILGDDKPHRRSDIVESASSDGFSHTGVDKALLRLVSTGQIICFKHGLYGSLRTSLGSATEFPPRVYKLGEKSSFRRVVELIHEQPQTAAVLREKVQVSRQRMEQILRKAESQGLIQRVATEFGEKGRFAYISASAARSEIAERASSLLERRKQLLSSLAPGKIYYARELASYFGVPATSQIREALIELAKLGLIHTVAVGIKLFCGLTPAGAAHRDYDPSAPKARPVDLVAEIGDRKSKYLQAMKVLGGSARTIDLTYAIGEAVTNGVRNNSGQMMQMLEEVGLVQRPQEKALGQRAYSLTATGQQVAALLDGYIVPPNRAALEASIALRMEIKADTLRRVAEQTNKRKAKQT